MGGEEGGAAPRPDSRGEPLLAGQLPRVDKLPLADHLRLADQAAARRPVWRGIGRRFGVGSAAGLAWDRPPVWHASHLVWRRGL